MHAGRLRVIVTLTLAAVPCLAPGLARAQAAREPSELVQALAQTGIIGMMDDDSVSVVEGRIPPQWAARLPVPPAGRVLGTVFGPKAATVYVVLRGTPHEAATLVEALAGPKGWVARRPFTPRGRPFLEQSHASGEPSQYCRGRHEQLVSGAQPFGSGTLLQLIYMSGSGFACEESEPMPGAREILPPLRPPPLAEGATPRSCSGATRTSENGMRLVSDASPAAILAIYGRQLEAAGWRPVAVTATPAVGVWSRTRPTGGTDQVQLVVTPEVGTQGACRSVSLTLEQRP